MYKRQAKYSVENRLIWLNGEIVHVNDARINVLSPTSQFGLNVFEGIPCFWNEEKRELYAFRLNDHYVRLMRSARLLHINCSYSINEISRALRDVIKANEYQEDLSVRQTLFVEGFGSWASKEPTGMFVAPIPKKMTSLEYNKIGLNCCTSSWRRINDVSLSPRIKCGANYINSRMAQLEALRNGYDTAILMNEFGKIAEGPGSCFFLIRDNKLVTPLITDSVLESITRDTVIQIAKEMGICVEERTIERTELYMCDGAFLCGSSMGITPIYSIDKCGINGDSDIIKEIHKKYFSIVRGTGEHREWLTVVNSKY